MEAKAQKSIVSYSITSKGRRRTLLKKEKAPVLKPESVRARESLSKVCTFEPVVAMGKDLLRYWDFNKVGRQGELNINVKLELCTMLLDKDMLDSIMAMDAQIKASKGPKEIEEQDDWTDEESDVQK